MIEKIIFDYLNDSLSLPVYTEIPKNPPQRFIAFEKTGGAQVNHINSSTIAVQSYGESLYDAAVINEEVKEEMLYGLISRDEIISVSLNSDYNYTDTTTKRYRYQAVFDIYHY